MSVECFQKYSCLVTQRYIVELFIELRFGATSPYTLVSGNRAGGSVLFSCNYEVLYAYCEDEISPDMWRQARQACITWGYDDATPFDRVRVI